MAPQTSAAREWSAHYPRPPAESNDSRLQDALRPLERDHKSGLWGYGTVTLDTRDVEWLMLAASGRNKGCYSVKRKVRGVPSQSLEEK